MCDETEAVETDLSQSWLIGLVNSHQHDVSSSKNAKNQELEIWKIILKPCRAAHPKHRDPGRLGANITDPVLSSLEGGPEPC